VDASRGNLASGGPDRAAAEPIVARLREVVPGAAVTVVVADPRDPDGLAAELERLRHGLPAAGVPLGRVLVLLAAHPDGRPADRGLGPRLRAALPVPALAHDPASSRCFTAGRTPGGIEVEVNDELREAELVIAVGPAGPGGSLAPLESLVVPGACSARTRASLARAPRELAAAACLVPVQLKLGHAARGAGPPCAPADAGPPAGAGVDPLSPP
jgi:hypothetical protein